MIEHNPLYIVYVVGYPSPVCQYYSEAAKEFGVNLKLKYHGCIVRTLYKDETGFTITDVGVESLAIEEQNKTAVDFYTRLLGCNWLNKIKNRAIEIYENQPDSDLPF